ncbi:MAG: polysaccharide biosynthesis tyrosine autokinase [Planctomycetota bacterium]
MSSNNTELTLPDVSRILWRNKWLTIGIVIVCIAATMVYIAYQPVVYSSRVQLYIESPSDGGFGSSQLVMSGSHNFLRSQGALIQSAEVMMLAAKRLGDSELFSGLESAEVAERLRGMTEAVVLDDRDVIEVVAKASVPEDAAEIANAVVDAFTDFHQKHRIEWTHTYTNRLVEDRALCEKEIDEMVAEIVVLREGVEVSALESAGAGTPALDRFRELTNAHTKADLHEIEMKARFDQAKQLLEEPMLLLQEADYQNESGPLAAVALSAGGLSVEIARMRANNATLRSDFDANHNVLKAMETKIAEMENQLDQQLLIAIEAHVSAAHEALRIAQRRKGLIQEQVDKQRLIVQDMGDRVSQLQLKEEQLQQLYRRLQSIDEQSATINLTAFELEERQAPILVLNPAKPNHTPASPQKAKLMAIGSFAGVFLGVGTALLVGLFDRRLRGTQDLVALGIAPIAATLPRKKTAKRGRVSELEPSGSYAEAVRSLRSSLLVQRDLSSTHVTMVTSATRGEGKSTVSSNLAITLAKSGHSTLLIDADLRHGVQANFFNLPKDKGLANISDEGIDPDDLISATPVPGLSIVQSGTVTRDLDQVLCGTDIQRALSRWARQYDHIVIDTSPLLLVSDARYLFNYVDQIVLVARCNVTSADQLLRASENIKLGGSEPNFIVLNDSSTEASYPMYGYAYSHPSAAATIDRAVSRDPDPEHKNGSTSPARSNNGNGSATRNGKH